MYSVIGAIYNEHNEKLDEIVLQPCTDIYYWDDNKENLPPL